MHISIPKHASDIIKTLSSHGYEAFVVGGCVRDSILGKEPADWDITTSALPEQVKALFSRTIDTGLKHGTVTIMMDKIGYEVTTYRIDGTYAVSYTHLAQLKINPLYAILSGFEPDNTPGVGTDVYKRQANRSAKLPRQMNPGFF